MRAIPAPRALPSRLSLSVAAAATAAIGALALALSLPGSAWEQLLPSTPPIPPGAGIAVIALLVVGSALLARPTSDALASLLLASACVGAGLAARSVAHAVAADGPLPDRATWIEATLLADAGMFWLSSLVVTAWAADRRHRIARWVAPLGIGLAAAAVLGSILRTWATVDVPTAAATTGTASSDLAVRISVAWRSGVTIVVPLALGVAGSLRADGRRFLASGRPGPDAVGEAGATRALWIGVGVALVAWAVTLGFPDVGPPYGAGLPSMLWLLIGVVAIRWSGFAAWASLAASLVLSAERPLHLAETTALGTVGPLRPLGDPTAVPLWWLSVALGWAVLAAGIWAGWRSLLAVAPAGRAPRLPAVALAASLGMAIALVASGRGIFATFELWAPPRGWPVPDAWAPFVVLTPVALGAVLLLRRRLVPAVAEAEAAVGHRFAPSEYLAIVTAETLTGSAGIRAAAEEAERVRLASDLHAEVLPVLTQALARSATDGPTEGLAEELRAVETGVRELIAERRLVVLEELGLVQALEWLVERAEDRGGPPIELTVDDASTEERPPRTAERAAFRIAQLALENALQHAEAARLRLAVLVRPDMIRLEIEDDGVGLPVGVGPGAMRVDHFGLADMRSQADRVGGRLEVGPARPSGTLVTFGWER
jgi:signal transduction histidine kinase